MLVGVAGAGVFVAMEGVAVDVEAFENACTSITFTRHERPAAPQCTWPTMRAPNTLVLAPPKEYVFDAAAAVS